MSRGGWMALTFGTVVALYGVFRLRFGSGAKSFLAVGLTTVLTAALILAVFTDVRHRLLKSDYGSAYSRIPMMKVALNVIKEKPFTGVGLNNYSTVMNRYDNTRENISYTFPFPVHNAFLIIASESGLLALFCFLIILSVTFIKALKFFQKGGDRFLSFVGIGWICGILTWVIHAQFKMDFAGIRPGLWFAIAMVIAIHQILFADQRKQHYMARSNQSSLDPDNSRIGGETRHR